MVGPSGAGKSTWSAAQGIEVVSSDEIRKERKPDGEVAGPQAEIFHEVRMRSAKVLGSGRSVIVDAMHIEADDRAFKDAVERAGRELGRIKGVVGVGYGIREQAGAFGDELAILVYVTRKLREAELEPAQRIPPRFEGYRVDVRVRPQLQLAAADCQPTLR